MHFCINLDKNAIETYEMIKAVFGQDSFRMV